MISQLSKSKDKQAIKLSFSQHQRKWVGKPLSRICNLVTLHTDTKLKVQPKIVEKNPINIALTECFANYDYRMKLAGNSHIIIRCFIKN